MDVAAVLALAVAAPALPWARCKGAALWDERGDGESRQEAADRHAWAISACRGCPALRACREWLESLQPAQRPGGVVAGQLVGGALTPADRKLRRQVVA